MSALISMRTSTPIPRVRVQKKQLAMNPIGKPHSPTRIDRDNITPSSRRMNHPSMPRLAWRDHQLVPIYPHLAGTQFFPHYPSMNPSMSDLSAAAQVPSLQASIQSTTAGPATIRYTPQQKREAVLRFKAKKMRRKNQSSAIRYQVRKRLADTRPRFRGRFFKPQPATPGKNH